MHYVVSVFFKSVHDPPAAEIQPLWEEIFLLMDATDEEHARKGAEEIAMSKAHEYGVLHPTPHVLRWSFVKVEAVHLVDGPLTHGAEIFARFLRASEAESMLTPFD